MSGREVIAVPTYLIHFRDNELALAVGAALEGRLAADGRDAIALVPAGDGLGLTRAADGGRGPGAVHTGPPRRWSRCMRTGCSSSWKPSA